MAFFFLHQPFAWALRAAATTGHVCMCARAVCRGCACLAFRWTDWHWLCGQGGRGVVAHLTSAWLALAFALACLCVVCVAWVVRECECVCE